MKIKTFTHPSENKWPEIIQRPVQDTKKIVPLVQKILDAVRNNGDKALIQFSKKFDKVYLSSLKVSKEEIEYAIKATPPALKGAINQAKKNIEQFHKSQLITHNPEKIITEKGIACWQEYRAIEKIGIYIPGGSAPLFSTVLMLAIPAAIAGCEEIILCSPPDKNGEINPAILYTAFLCGVQKIYKAGGAQAIAAMAYGTQTIPRVHKIFGPGNQFVTTAKQLVQTSTAIDMPAGPSEVLVIGDETSDPDFIAADLLAQAEHGPDSQVVFVTTDKNKTTAVKDAILHQLANLPRKEIALKALQYARFVVVKNLQEAILFSNTYAPEHLIISCNISAADKKMIKNAGSVFLGRYSPESAGDYASGTNHTLPTNGYATAFSGVNIDSYLKKISFQELSRDGLKKIASAIQIMAEAEGLQAHSNAVKIRFKK